MAFEKSAQRGIALFVVVLCGLAIAVFWNTAQTRAANPSFNIQQISTSSRDSFSPSITADGRLVVFYSNGDLTGENQDQNEEIFLYNSNLGGINQMTDTVSGSNLWPTIDAAGTRIVFNSSADLTGENADGSLEVFLFDPVSNNFTQITDCTACGTQTPIISGDGRKIIFNSASDLTGGNQSHSTQIFLHTVDTGTLVQLTDGRIAGASILGSISYDGRIVAFSSSADFTGDNTDGSSEIFLINTETLSINQITSSVSFSGSPSIDGAARLIAFNSYGDLTGNNADGGVEIFLYDTAAQLVTQLTDGGGIFPTIDSSGNRVVFYGSGSLVGGDPNIFQVFVYDISTDSLSQVTNSATSVEDFLPAPPTTDADGTKIAFHSDANLTGGNQDGSVEVFFASRISDLCFDTDNNGFVDNDNDGLCDNWEEFGIDWNKDGVIDYALPDSDTNVPDIYVELDWMEDHRPANDALEEVRRSFLAQGFRLHVQVDEEAVSHKDEFAFFGCTPRGGDSVPDFDTVKADHFGTPLERSDANRANLLSAKRLVFHYGIFVHSLLGTDSSGCGEVFGNDLVVSLPGLRLGSIEYLPGKVGKQAATFMHELGHNLGLEHGGRGDPTNCKPNYLSIMSYSRQFDNLVRTRRLDFSGTILPTLSEAPQLPRQSALNESFGIQEFSEEETVYGPPTAGRPDTVDFAEPKQTEAGWVVVTPAELGIDWNKDGDTEDIDVSADINDLGINDCGSTPGESLRGSNDWANLELNFRSSSNFADGVHVVVPEIGLGDALRLSPDSDGDGLRDFVDNCPDSPNPGQEDSNFDGIGDVCSPNLPVSLDVRPGSCPNPINAESRGVLPVSIAGTADFNPLLIASDGAFRVVAFSTTNATDVAGESFLRPRNSEVEDVTAPFMGSDVMGCLDCVAGVPDGFPDLILKFDTQDVLQAIRFSLGREPLDRECLVLRISGQLPNTRSFEGQDVIVVLQKDR